MQPPTCLTAACGRPSRQRAAAEEEELARLGLQQRTAVEEQSRLLQEQQERAAAEGAERERLQAELAELESKIMHGGEHVSA